MCSPAGGIPRNWRDLPEPQEPVSAPNAILRVGLREPMRTACSAVTPASSWKLESPFEMPGMQGEADITGQLLAWRAGDARAPDRLFPLVYDELRRIAHHQLGREREGHTLDTPALVHETYLRLADQTRVEWADRSHFFAVATEAMRRILVDYARRYRTEKRGRAPRRVSLTDDMLVTEQRADTLMALDEALGRLAEVDDRLRRVVECRFFGGLTDQETADVLGITARTVRRDWTKAKGWLQRVLR